MLGLPEEIQNPTRPIRSRRQVRVACVFGVVLIVLGIGSAPRVTPAWAGLVQGGVFVAVGLGEIALFAVRTGIWVTPRGVRVRNPFVTFEVPWDEIREFRIGRHGPFPAVCLIDLTDGSTRYAFSVAVPNRALNDPNVRERRIVTGLNELLNERRGASGLRREDELA
jgi:hypothetical protein